MHKIKFLFVVLACMLVFGLAGFVLAKSDNAQNGNVEQNQNQNQNQNQGEEIQNREQEQEQEQGQDNKIINIEEHKNTVSNFVQELLNVADKEKGGIGEQVRVIAQEQNQIKEKIAEKLEKVQSRNKVRTFLFGSDYKNLGELRSEMVQTRNRLEQLNRLTEQAQNEADKTQLQEQIQAMEQERTRIENFIEEHDSKFSLFGWVRKLFRRGE